MSASLPSDWFVRLTDEGEDRGKLIFRLQEETFTISAGTLVEVDPEDTALNYGGPYAVRHEGEVLLAAVWPPEGRPKDGPRPMHLRPWGRGLTSMWSRFLQRSSPTCASAACEEGRVIVEIVARAPRELTERCGARSGSRRNWLNACAGSHDTK
jgi:hypothetical protein